MRRIIISQSIYEDNKRRECGDKLDAALLKFVMKAGHLPIPFSNFYFQGKKQNCTTTFFSQFLNCLNPHGLVLSGGADFGVYKERDATEKKLINWCIVKNLPILGICRGMQHLGLIGGGKLRKFESHVNTEHRIYGEHMTKVNSYHKFGFKELPSEFQIIATSEDGCIEAFQHKKNKWLGWMWHPEREKNFQREDLDKFNEFFI